MKKVIALLLPLVVVISCYDPSGENFVNVPAPVTTGIVLDLAEYTDTIFVFQSESVILMYQGKPSLEEINVSINNESVRSGGIDTWGPPNFYVDVMKFGTGFYSVEVTAIAKTNSGSLADKINVEKMSITKEFVLAVDIDPVPSLPVHFDTSDGRLRVSWKPYKKKNFVSYELWQDCWNCMVASTTDPDDTTFIDTQFTVGRTNYRLVTVTSTGAHSGEESFLTSFSDVAITSLPDNKLELTFSRPACHANVKEIRVYQLGSLVHTDVGFSDTTVVVENDFPFGDRIMDAFEIEFVPDGPASGIQMVPYEIGSRILDMNIYDDWVRKVEYNQSLNQYYVKSRRYLRVLDHNFNKQAEREYNVQDFTISANGSYMYAEMYNSWTGKYQMCSVNPITLDTLNLKGFDNIYVPHLQVANTNYLSTYTNNYPSPDRHYVQALPNLNAIYVRSVVSGALSAISPDGEHFFSYNTLYKIEGTTFTQIATIPVNSNEYMAVFRADNPDELLLISNSGVRALSISTDNVRSLSVNGAAGSWILQYDPVSKSVLYTGSAKSIVLDVDTGASFTIPSKENVAFSLTNGKLISSHSYVADLSFIKSLAK